MSKVPINWLSSKVEPPVECPRIYQVQHDVFGRNTVDQNIVSRYYDGNGREVKRQRTIFAEDVNMTEPPYGSWTIEVPTYYIRSSVLGGETLTEVNGTGRKIKTNVIAAGAKIATQSEYTYNNNTNESVSWNHTDASGMSHRGTTANGSAVYGDGQYDGAPAELDPLGGNMGTATPYVELLPDPPPPSEEYPFFPIDSDQPFYVNGQRVTCTLDGMAIGCAQAQQALDSGTAVQCPNNNCGPITAYVNGRPTLTMPFAAYADGRNGWMVPIWHQNIITVEGSGGGTTTFPAEIIGWRFQAAETTGSPFMNASWGNQVRDSRFTPPDLPSDLRERVVRIASSCKDAFDKFLGAFGSNLIESNDFEVLYDRVTKGRKGEDLTQERIKFSSKNFDPKGTAAAEATGPTGLFGKRGILINSNPGFIPDDPLKAANYLAAIVVQELFHHAKKKGRFSDDDLDAAALSLMSGEIRERREAYMQRKDYKAGSVGHGYINEICPSIRR